VSTPLQPRATSVAFDGRNASLARQGSSSMTVSGASAAAASMKNRAVRPTASASRSVDGAACGGEAASLAGPSPAAPSLLLVLHEEKWIGGLWQRCWWSWRMRSKKQSAGKC